MKFSLLAICALLSSFSFAQIRSGYLSAEDQKYYKNDIMEGNNQRERTDSIVKEINKMYADMALMKSQIQNLQKEIEELKKNTK